MKIDLTSSSPPGDEQVQQALKHAEERLAHFHNSVTGPILLERLSAERPAHPLLLTYKFALLLAAVGLTVSLLILALPLVSTDLLAVVARFEGRIAMPLPLVLTGLALCCGGLGAGMRQLAIMRAEQSPLLPEERKVFQEISSEVQRLKSAKSLEDNKYVTY